MPMLLQLPDELLTEILGYLPPSQIIRSSRKVCRHFWRISKERITWLTVLARCDYALPYLDYSSTPVDELERTLLCAELVKDVWTGRQKLAETPQQLGSPLLDNTVGDIYIGLMKDYVVIGQVDQQAQWSWYALGGVGNPTFVFTPELDLFQEIHTWSAEIARDTGIFYAAYTQTDRLPEGNCHYLKIVSVRIPTPSRSFEPKLEINYRIEDPMLFRAISTYEDFNNPPLEIEVAYGYVAVYSYRLAPRQPIRLFNVETGKLVLCPWHEKVGGEFWPTRLHFDITPWHFVQHRRDSGEFEFFHLPTSAELKDAKDSTLHTYRVNTVTLPHFPAMPSLFPRSPSSYMVFLHSSSVGDERFHLLELDLLSSATHVTRRSTYQLGSNDVIRCIRFPPTPPSSMTMLTAAVGERQPTEPRQHETFVLLGIWVTLDATMIKNGSPMITVTELDTLDPDGHEIFGFDVVDVDPCIGRVVQLLTVNNPEVSYTRVQDYISL